MTEESITYTITSTDTESYDVIRTNLQIPKGGMCRLIATNLTTKASFVVLDQNDYIVINGVKHFISSIYGEISTETLALLINGWDIGVEASIDNVKRLVLISNSYFVINEMSYNLKMTSGFYNDPFPIYSNPIDDKYYVRAESVGYSLLTPILYLISNLGSKCYDNINRDYMNHKVLMRVSNSFTAGYPIINGNAEFASIVPVNSLSDIEFRLVDANMKPIKLLSPMYLSVRVDSVESKDEDAKIDINALMMRENNVGQGREQGERNENES